MESHPTLEKYTHGGFAQQSGTATDVVEAEDTPPCGGAAADAPGHHRGTSVSPWYTVVGVGSVLNGAAFLLTIYCNLKRRCRGGSGATAETQAVHPDSNSDTYTALNMRNRSPEYDTLTSLGLE
ncbi:hypothetical protein UPYG_G00059720 [Umbra pygmaea]|uniref:Uncharacterized protein n=1 Tax=Umbra pygmaea TaxID=75934 RepID=A0ABD0X9A8_UMBPY